MKKIARKNQIIIATLAVMIAAAGYMNYSGKIFSGKSKTQQTSSELASKELLDISEEDAAATSGDINSQDGTKSDGSVDGTPGEAVLTNGNVSSVAAQAKVSREQVRSRNKETLQNMDISEEEKKDAINQMVQMTEISEKETAAESLLAAKGFSDAVVSITDEQADVIVGASELSDANRAQIEDIVTRKTGVAAQNIVINPVYADESTNK